MDGERGLADSKFKIQDFKIQRFDEGIGVVVYE
jgi:hypothetical protein